MNFIAEEEDNLFEHQRNSAHLWFDRILIAIHLSWNVVFCCFEGQPSDCLNMCVVFIRLIENILSLHILQLSNICLTTFKSVSKSVLKLCNKHNIFFSIGQLFWKNNTFEIFSPLLFTFSIIVHVLCVYVLECFQCSACLFVCKSV